MGFLPTVLVGVGIVIACVVLIIRLKPIVKFYKDLIDDQNDPFHPR